LGDQSRMLRADQECRDTLVKPEILAERSIFLVRAAICS